MSRTLTEPDLPSLPAFGICALSRPLGRLDRWRLDPDEAFLVRWPEGLRPPEPSPDLETLTASGGGTYVLVRRPLGEDPLSEAPFGEADASALFERAVEALTPLWRSARAHGFLWPWGIELLPGGRVSVIPPEIARAAGPPEGDPAPSAAARDLLDLARFAAHWAVGREPEAVARGGQGDVSPALRAALGRLLREAHAAPEPAAVPALLAALPWPPRARSAGAEGGALRAGPSPRARRERRRGSPAWLGFALAFGVLSAGVLMFLRSERTAAPVRTLPALGDSNPQSPRTTESDPNEDLARRMLERIGETFPKERGEGASGASGSRIDGGAASDVDRQAIEHGDALVEQARRRLEEVRARKGSRAERRRRLDEAIALLEKARKSFESFAEQYPARKRLVEDRITEVNSLIFFATRQRTLR